MKTATFFASRKALPSTGPWQPPRVFKTQAGDMEDHNNIEIRKKEVKRGGVVAQAEEGNGMRLGRRTMEGIGREVERGCLR